MRCAGLSAHRLAKGELVASSLSVRFTRKVVVAFVGLVLIGTSRTGHAQALPGDALPFSKNYLITGNYVVGGVTMRPQSGGNGFVTDTIPMTGVPANADILAAFLYWETIWTDVSQTTGAQFRGSPVTAVKKSSIVLNPNTAPCWSSGGGSGAPYTLTEFRADVLRLLPVQLDANNKPTGRRLVNDVDLQKYGFPLNTVTLPSAGTGNQVPQSGGAALFVVYRDPTQPLTNIAVYDGVSLQAPGAATNQAIRGFLQSSTSHTAKMTQIVGLGAKNKTTQLYFNGTLIATDPFVGPSSSAVRALAFPTYNVTSLMPGNDNHDGYGEIATTSVTHGKTTAYDCLTWAAIIFSTTVPDRDGDGLVDRLEDSSTDGAGNQWKDASGQPLPDLHAMGASSAHKDLFVEIAAMVASPGTSYGVGAAQVVDAVGHNHTPTPGALKMVGDAYSNAQVVNPDGTTGIRVHFDVGPNFDPGAVADPYIIRGGLARGGETIAEQACVADAQSPPRWTCLFPAYPGTVTWKRGFNAHKNAWVDPVTGNELDEATQAACDVSGTCTRRRFDRVLTNYFHWVLFAHAWGIPASPLVCLDATGTPVAAVMGICAPPLTVNPANAPQSRGGRADLPAGGDAMVTLGFWNKFVGTDFNQASTLVHELGHNFGLWHGGAPPVYTEVQVQIPNSPAPVTRANVYFEPNCKSNYLSSMNYLFQLHGLIDANGNPQLAYSNGVNADLDETFLSDGFITPLAGSPPPAYRTAWFAPRVLPDGTPTLAVSLGTPAAKKHCDGSTLSAAEEQDRLNGRGMVRVDAPAVGAEIDWNADGINGKFDAVGYRQDVDFDGVLSGTLAGPPTQPLHGFNDVAMLRLDQVGSRLQGGGFSAGGDLDIGGGDLDFGGGDLDFGGGDLDIGGGDLDIGGGDLDFGGGDLEFGGGGPELDVDTAKAVFGLTPPNGTTACVSVSAVLDPANPNCTGAPLHRVKVSWSQTNVGGESLYHVQRYPTLGGAVVEIGGSPVSAPATTLVDTEELPNGVQFTYRVSAQFPDGTLSGPSVLTSASTITAVNDAPGVVNHAYTVNRNNPLTVAAPGVLASATDDDSPAPEITAVLTTPRPPSHGALVLNADGSFTYTPMTGFAGTDTFTYKANDGPWSRNPNVPLSADSNIGTVTIAVITPPLVTLTIPAPNGQNGWFTTSPVSVGVSATDPFTVTSITCSNNGSPIGVGNLVGLGSSAATGTLAVGGEGAHNLTCLATNGKGLTGAAPGSANTGVVKIDTVPPLTSIDSGPSGEIATASATFSFHATDATSGVASYACQLDGAAFSTCTSPMTYARLSIGPHTFSVRAADNAGNAGNSASRAFTVVYAFTLTPLKSPANLGSAVPIIWQLSDPSGVPVNSLSTLLRMESVFNGSIVPAGGCVASTAGTRQTLFNQPIGATGNSSFRLVSPGYQFNWDTGTAAATGKGCYTVLIYLNDQSTPKMTNAVQLN
jgi:hypothetical protein